MEFDMELLRRNKFCRGIKRGREYVCGGEADEGTKSNAIELLAEAVRRILKWRVWETWWVDEAMDEWLEKRDRLEVQLRGKYSEEVVNAITGLVNEFINYNEKFLNYWQTVGGEAEKLVDDLLSSRAEVVIWSNEGGVSVHYGHVTLEAHRAGGSVTVQLVLNGLEGVTIKVPDVFVKTMSREEYERFINEVLMALRGGLEEADGFVENGYAAMETTQTWQVVVWALLYPGENFVYANAVNVNEGSVTITYYMVSYHKPLKGKIFGNVDKLGEEELLAFMLGAVLGDGWTDVVKPVMNGRVYDEAVITITMADERYKAWEPLFERLGKMGFRSGKPNLINGNEVKVAFNGSNAIDLARAMISILPPILRDVLDALAFEKWERIKRIAEMEMKFRRGEMRIDVGYRFSVSILKGTIALVHRAKDEAEAEKVIEALRAVYGDEFYAYVNKSGKYLVVIIPMYVFEKYEDIKAQVVKVLCEKLEKTKDEKKRQIIIKYLKRLTPTKGAAAVDHGLTRVVWLGTHCLAY